MAQDPEITKEQLQTIGRLVVDILQGAVQNGVEEISIGDLMRTFGFTEEESEPWDEAILVFIKDGSEQQSTTYIIH